MERNEIVKSWLLVALPVVFVVMLFLCRDSLIRFGSSGMTKMQGKEEATSMADSVKLLYDYSDKPDGHRYTFLEFGAKGCLSCQKMETVMEEIKKEHTGKVNVRFLNLTKEECQPWAQYFGIVTIPTQVILDNTGREIFRHSGYISAEDLEKLFKE